MTNNDNKIATMEKSRGLLKGTRSVDGKLQSDVVWTLGLGLVRVRVRVDVLNSIFARYLELLRPR